MFCSQFRRQLLLCSAAVAACSAPAPDAPAAAPDWTHRTVAVGSGDSIHLVHRGLGAERTLVFVPGMGDDWASYRSLSTALPEHSGMVLVDPLGHGASSKRRGANGPGRQAEALAAALDSLGVRPFAIIGHSYGGVILQYYGAAHPELPAAVIMAAVSSLRTNAFAADFAEFSATLPDTVPESVAALQSDGFFEPVHDSVLRPYVATSLATPGWVWREGIDTMLASDTRDFLGAWRPRTLLVMAENDKVIGRESMDDLVRALPGADTVRIPRTSHAMHWERPEAVGAAIEAFLAPLAPGRSR